jgi:hypothetical protein
MEATFYLLPLAPAAVVERLGRFAEGSVPDVVITSFECYSALATFGFVEKSKVPGRALFENGTFQNHLAILANHPYLDFTHGTLQLAHPQGQISVQYMHQQSDRILKVTIPDAISVPERLKMTEVLHKHFQLLRQDQVLTSRTDPADTPIARFAEGVVQDMAAQGAKLAQLSADKLNEFNQILIDKTAALEKLYQDKEQQLANAYTDKEKQLTDRINLQQEKERAFDLRENTVVRRAIFDKLTQIIDDQKKVEVTPDTQKNEMSSVAFVGASLVWVQFWHWSERIDLLWRQPSCQQ